MSMILYTFHNKSYSPFLSFEYVLGMFSNFGHSRLRSYKNVLIKKSANLCCYILVNALFLSLNRNSLLLSALPLIIALSSEETRTIPCF